MICSCCRDRDSLPGDPTCAYCLVYCPDQSYIPTGQFERAFYNLAKYTNHHISNHIEDLGFDPEHRDPERRQRALRLLEEDRENYERFVQAHNG